MPPDALPQLIDVLRRLPALEVARLKELIHTLPDAQAATQEMLRRGWITQDQFSYLFPGPPEPAKARETLLVGFGDDDVPPDIPGDNWDLPVSDEEETLDAHSSISSDFPVVIGVRAADAAAATELQQYSPASRRSLRICLIGVLLTSAAAAAGLGAGIVYHSVDLDPVADDAPQALVEAEANARYARQEKQAKEIQRRAAEGPRPKADANGRRDRATIDQMLTRVAAEAHVPPWSSSAKPSWQTPFASTRTSCKKGAMMPASARRRAGLTGASATFIVCSTITSRQ